jgi:predicted unusual protein kinase regulating ubiquinone biosynthesis (AarF/ABC1/UbiB family)
MFVMELPKLTWILVKETFRYAWKGSFDYESFWQQCIQVNILYTKFFQALSGKYMFSSVHSIPFSPEEFEPTFPVTKILGSGLISIVYESSWEDKPIVVKIKRKNIDARIQSSIDSLEWYLDWIHWLYPIPTPLVAFEEIKESFLTQLDYVQEVKNHKLFQSIASYHFIKTPTLIESECNDVHIVMSKIDHIPMTLLNEKDLQTSISHLVEMVLHLLTHHGFIHADLHLGNILFQGDALGIIDFGFVIQLTSVQKDTIYELVKGLILHDYESSAHHTMEFVCGDLNEEQRKDIMAFIVHVYQKSMEIHHSFSVYNFYELNTKLNKYNACFNPLFYKIVMGLHSVETLITQIKNPDYLSIQLALLLCVHDEKCKVEGS